MRHSGKEFLRACPRSVRCASRQRQCRKTRLPHVHNDHLAHRSYALFLCALFLCTPRILCALLSLRTLWPLRTLCFYPGITELRLTVATKTKLLAGARCRHRSTNVLGGRQARYPRRKPHLIHRQPLTAQRILGLHTGSRIPTLAQRPHSSLRRLLWRPQRCPQARRRPRIIRVEGSDQIPTHVTIATRLLHRRQRNRHAQSLPTRYAWRKPQLQWGSTLLCTHRQKRHTHIRLRVPIHKLLPRPLQRIRLLIRNSGSMLAPRHTRRRGCRRIPITRLVRPRGAAGIIPILRSRNSAARHRHSHH